MASRFGSRSRSGKRPKYVDLDVPNPSSKDLWDIRLFSASSNPSTSLSGSKKPKKAKNPNSLGTEYKVVTQKYVLQYYKVWLLEMLNRSS